MALRVLIGVGVVAGALWWSLDPADVPAPPAPEQARPAVTHAPMRPAPLPALDPTDAPPERMPTDAPIVATNLRPARYIAPRVPTVDDSRPDSEARASHALGSLRMPADPDSLGVTGQGFVPIGGEVPQPGGGVDPPTIDLSDPEELRFKQEAGDFDNPIDAEEQIKRNAYGDGQVGVGETAGSAADSASNSEVHIDGVVVDPADVPDITATERHVDGRRPTVDWRAAGLSPTEANMVEVEDVTRNYVAPIEPPSDTIAEDPPVPTYAGEGTVTDP